MTQCIHTHLKKIRDLKFGLFFLANGCVGQTSGIKPENQLPVYSLRSSENTMESSTRPFLK